MSFLKRAHKKKKESLFFLTQKGTPVPSSQILNRLTQMSKLFDDSIVGNFTGKRIRKSAVSRHRQIADCRTATLSKDKLVRQMLHTTTTVEGHYAMRDQIKGKICKLKVYMQSLGFNIVLKFSTF